MVASGSSAMSMAVTGFCCALDVPAWASSAPRPVTNAARRFKFLCIEISISGQCRAKNGRSSRSARSLRTLVAGVALLDRLFNLLFHGGKVERGALLHGRKFDGRGSQLANLLLHVDEAPEFACVEVVEVGRRAFEHVGDWQPLERILLDVLQDRHIDRHFRSRPTLGLIDEAIFEFIETQGAEI